MRLVPMSSNVAARRCLRWHRRNDDGGNNCSFAATVSQQSTQILYGSIFGDRQLIPISMSTRDKTWLTHKQKKRTNVYSDLNLQMRRSEFQHMYVSYIQY